MSDVKISLPYLEGLTTDELNALAKEFTLEIAPNKNRSFIIKELLEFAPCLNLYQRIFYKNISLQIIPPEEPDMLKTTLELPDPAPLPKQYNMTYINVLVRDPFWIFVFWEISGNDRKRHEKNPAFEGYILRVRLHECIMEHEADRLYTARISIRDSVRYLHFPPETACRKLCALKSDCAFVVELCAVLREKEIPLVASSPFNLPLSMPAYGSQEEEALHKQILVLSGIEELKILRC